MASERNPDTLPTPGDPCGPCPRCGLVANFDVTSQGVLSTVPDPQWGARPQDHIATLACHGCKDSTIVITDHLSQGIHWYPAPGAGQLDPDVNAGVASAYDEGMRCLGIGANRAAAVMFRSSLSLYVRHKGSPAAQSERHLKTALKHMKDDGALHASLWDWADHLNQLGNEGAHPEDYDDVTAEEAKALAAFLRHLIKHEYEMPAELVRARANGSTAPEQSSEALADG